MWFLLWHTVIYDRYLCVHVKTHVVTEVLLGPRAAPIASRKTAQGMASNPQGYYILTPFLLAGTDESVFINRGWVPLHAKIWSRPTGRVRIRAVMTEEEQQARFSPQNDPSSKKLLWLEYKSLVSAANMTLDKQDAVVVMDAIDDNLEKLPLTKSKDDYLQQAVPPFSHLVYATTWQVT